MEVWKGRFKREGGREGEWKNDGKEFDFVVGVTH